MKKNDMTNQNERGFTLVEILVATVVFVIASMMFMGIFAAVSNVTMRIESRRFAQQDARYAIEQMAREIRNGWEFDVEDDGKRLIYKSKADDSDSLDDAVTTELYVEEATDDKGETYMVIYKTNPGSAVPTMLTSGIVEIKDVRFSLIKPVNEYPIVEIDMDLKKMGDVRFNSTVPLMTRVTSRVRDAGVSGSVG